MRHHVDIRVRPDLELTAPQLMSALYRRLHLVLAHGGREDIGVSFPEHDEQVPFIGNVLRLHGTDDVLSTLMSLSWLGGVADHVRIERLGLVPEGAVHRLVSRVQAKSSADRLRRRAMRRHGIDAEQAAARIPYSVAERLALPFVMMGSASTGQASFPLFIRHGEFVPAPVPGRFNSYGLSLGASVPWF